MSLSANFTFHASGISQQNDHTYTLWSFDLHFLENLQGSEYPPYKPPLAKSGLAVLTQSHTHIRYTQKVKVWQTSEYDNLSKTDKKLSYCRDSICPPQTIHCQKN